MFDSYIAEEFSSSSMQKAMLSIVNVPVSKFLRQNTNHLLINLKSTQIALDTFCLSQLPTFS